MNSNSPNERRTILDRFDENKKKNRFLDVSLILERHNS